MTMDNVYTSAPMPIYFNNQQNEFVNQDYQVHVSNGSDMSLEDFRLYPALYPSLNQVQAPNFPPLPFQHPNNFSCYQPPPSQMGIVTPPFTFPSNGVTYNGGMVPTLTPSIGFPQSYTPMPSFMTTPSQGSSSSSPLQHLQTPSPISVRKGVQKASGKSKSKGKLATRNATQTAKEKLIGKSKRKRGPNKRPPGTAFSTLLDGLSKEVTKALEKVYKGCCESVNTTDFSTKQKHVFSNRHCKNLSAEHQEQIPNFVCPAFVAFNTNCRSKVGRYDSTDRHCKNCVGFDQINKTSRNGAFPVVVTRAQYTALHDYRLAREESEGKGQAQEARRHAHVILGEIFPNGFPDWFPRRELYRDDSANENTGEASAQFPTGTLSLPPPAEYLPAEQSSSYQPIDGNNIDEWNFLLDPLGIGL